MCGRYSLTSPVESIRALFEFEALPNLAARYNIAPTQDAPVVRRAAGGGREFVAMRWGLVPSWANEISRGAPLINARAETVAEKPAFRGAYRQRRCLVPVDGFYEWRKEDDGTKQAFRIAMADDAPFAFAGIWESWGEADTLESFAIITTDANHTLAPVHHRMPVILAPQDYDAWLTAPNAALLRPYDGELRAYAISSNVNRVVNDDPSLWEPEAPRPAPPRQLDLL